MEVLNHAHSQAEQLAMIIHFKGKATVKTAPKNILKPKKDALVERGLSAVIEEIAWAYCRLAHGRGRRNQGSQWR